MTIRAKKDIEAHGVLVEASKEKTSVETEARSNKEHAVKYLQNVKSNGVAFSAMSDMEKSNLIHAMMQLIGG